MQPTATNSAQALSNLQGYQATEKAPQDILTSQEQSLGVPAAQQQVSGLRQAITNSTNLLNQVAPSVYGRTQNSLVTNAQATNQIANEQAPINTQLNKENTDYQGASTDYQNLLGQAGTLAGLQAQGQQNQEGYLKDIYSALYGQEQDAAKLAEQQREANLSASSSGSGGGGLGSALASILGGGASSAPAAVGSYGLKQASNPAGGYYFRDASGRAINALQYAQQSGIDFQGLIQKMADSGDAGAKEVLPFVSGNTIKAGVLSPSLIKAFTG